MIYLNTQDIHAAANVNELVDAIEESMVLYEDDRCVMPQRMHVDYEGNTLLLMPCFTQSAFGTKLVSLFPDNPSKGVPVLTGLVVLNDICTGQPLAVLDGPTLTAMRTAAVASVSIRHLVSDDARSVGVIGAGVQGYYQAWIACASKGFSKVFIFDLVAEKAQAMSKELADVLPGVDIKVTAAVEELLSNSNAVITATTSLEPVLPDDAESLKGKHFVGIGSYKPEMREFPKAIFGLIDKVYVDTDHALGEAGDLIVPLREGWIKEEQVMTFGRFLKDKNAIGSTEETTFFKSVGMAIFDVCASRLIYEKAMEKDLGQKLKV